MADRNRISRRTVLKTSVGLGVGTAVAGCNFMSSGDDPSGRVGTELVADGFTAPLGMVVPPGSPDHRLVVDQTGTVEVVDPAGNRAGQFLDVTDRMVKLSGYEERGLLGLALHPQFQQNRRVFVRYSAPLEGGMPDGYSHTFVLSEFRAPNGLQVDPDTERRLLTLAEPQSNHNAGDLAFGPDGYLYVGVGDGGGGNDVGRGHVSDWYDDNAGGNGQDVRQNLLGSILRIDVDTTEGGRPYGIPSDNPLVGRKGMDEHYAWGFRNPWRLTFTEGELYVADVGQNRYEEVNLVEKGGNYGWNVLEGTHCFDASSPESDPTGCPSTTGDGNALRAPIVEYPHSGSGPTGIAVIGGYRYLTGTVAPLQGRYVFGDWRSQGTIFAASERDVSGTWPIDVLQLAPTDGNEPGDFLLGFGRDSAGELYVLTTDNQTPRGSSGGLYRLVEPPGQS